MDDQKEMRKDNYDGWNELFLEAAYGELHGWGKFTKRDRTQLLGVLRKLLRAQQNKYRGLLRKSHEL